MEIAAQHAERQSVGTRQNMEERFFLGWITRECGDVVCGHTQMAAFIKAYFANAAFPLLDEAAMAAGVTLEGAGFEMFS